MKRTTSSELLVRLSRGSGVPLRLQLERELRLAIQTGRLPAGAALPASRALAADLELSRGVVVEAYDQLLAEGYLVAIHGSATRVAAGRAIANFAPPVRATVPVPRYDFRPGLPDLSLFPLRAWMSSMRRGLTAISHVELDYPDPRGAEHARVALASYLNRARATVVEPDRMVICTGSAQGIGLLCNVLRERGIRRIAVEDPGHADQCTNIRMSGLDTPRIPVDQGGLRVDRLSRVGADAVLVTPAHQYPTGSVLAPERRAALLEWAAKRGAVIIEDDYDAEYRYDREPIGALQGLAPDRVAYVGSASKVLSPALRLGWLALPADLAGDVARAKLRADRGSPITEQLAMADFLNRGAFDRHLRRTRQIYRERRDALVSALLQHFPRVRVHGVAAGLHLMIELDPGVDEEAVLAAAERRSVRVYGASSYRAQPDSGQPALVIGYGGLPVARIPEAVRELALILFECGQLRRPKRRG